ncbi:hypothetical protein Tco_0000940 [Tanacetum coccineum]
MVDEEADPTRDLEEPERLLVKDPHFMEIQVHSVITKPEPFIHTQPMSPLYGIFESYKSSTKPYKVDREIKSPSRYFLWKPSRDFTRLLRPPSSLKGLLHTLNVIVILKKRLQDDAHGGLYRMMHRERSWIIIGYKITSKSGLVDHHAIDDDGIIRMGQDKLQDSIWEHDNDLEEDQEDDGDERILLG